MRMQIKQGVKKQSREMDEEKYSKFITYIGL